MHLRLAIMLFAIAIAIAIALPASATTLFHHADIRTLDADNRRAEAMVVGEDGRILALGAVDQLARDYPAARHHDLGGGVVLPGLIDAHGHLLNLGLALLSADLVGARSKDEVVQRLLRFAATLPPRAGLTGRGWDQNLWPEAEFPTAADLDAAFPDRPVWLRRVDGHASWGNSAALRAATRELSGDWHPEGGRILRDDDGHATGVFIDTAMALIQAPQPDAAFRRRALEMAVAEAARLGLTGVHDAGMNLEALGFLREMAEAGRLPIRVYAMADGDGATLDWLCENGPYQHPGGRLTMRAVKLYADGALGSRGAALIADYSDDPGNRGLLVTAEDRLRAAVTKALRCDIQVATHAIGDRANRSVLDLYRDLVADAARPALRLRIEHAQIVARDDLPRFAELGVIASMQPIHATSDIPWAGLRVGRDRLYGAYAWQRLIESGARLAFGSDFPVEPVNPAFGLYAALTRQDVDGDPPGGWLPDQRLDLETTLRAFTLGAAYAGFADDEVGSLAVGKRADFIVVDQDPFVLDPQALRAIKVRATYLDGLSAAASDP
ncbi:MAG TPA: amidohydrolase [Xanthomonadaceae bacterium]|nr:amidohydrolase [Xanthomonadaceae bacterium]